MKDVLRELAARQDDVVAVWQLRRRGLTRSAADHQVRGLPELQDGVHLTGHAPPIRRQRMWAAALTAPDRFVSHASAGDAYGFRPWAGAFEVVTGVGSGGPRRFP